jgi:hypothetical protein
MVWMQEFPQMVYWLHFRKDGLKPNRKALTQMDLRGGMNCLLQMVLTTGLKGGSSGLKVSLPTAQTGGMTNRMKRPVTYDLKYCSKTSVPKLNEKGPKKYGMLHFLSVQMHKTRSLTMQNLAAKRPISFSLIP